MTTKQKTSPWNTITSTPIINSKAHSPPRPCESGASARKHRSGTREWANHGCQPKMCPSWRLCCHRHHGCIAGRAAVHIRPMRNSARTAAQQRSLLRHRNSALCHNGSRRSPSGNNSSLPARHGAVATLHWWWCWPCWPLRLSLSAVGSSTNTTKHK